MAKPLTDVIADEFREAIRSAAEKFQLPNIMIIGILEIIQNEISKDEMIRLQACVHDWIPDDDDDNELAVCSKCGETDSIDIIGMPQE